jgi:hypothetical protein
MPIGLDPIEATVNWTGPTSGAGPLNISWSITIGSGGLPPYQVVVDFENYVGGSFDWNSTSLNGTASLTVPDMYVAVAEVVDSSCDSVAASVFGPITVYPASGLNPVQISSSTAGGSVPLAVQYSVNGTRLGPNETMLWQTPVSWQGSGWSANTTYYRGGNYTASGCLVDATTAVWLACGTSSLVVATGSDLATGVVVGNGSQPVPITYYLNVTNASALPAHWVVDLWTENGTLLQTTSNNSTNSVTGNFGCGPADPTNPPDPTGVCTWTGSYLITASPNGTAEYVTEGTIWANLTELGNPVLWYPTLTYNESASNGSAPLNVTVNLTASNGLAPYQYWWAVFAASSAATNRTFYPTLNGNGSGWNGSAMALVFSFAKNGIYMIALTVVDSDKNPVFAYPPVIAVGVALAPPPPMVLSAAETNLTAAGTSGDRVGFVATVTGGEGPFTVQWAFGDGTYGSSLPGATVAHSYGTAGTYRPTVTVTDRFGATTTTALAPVNVAAGPATTPANHSTGPTGPVGHGNGASTAGGPPSLVATVPLGTLLLLVAALVIAAVGIYQAERYRTAENLVRGLESDAAAPPGEPPSEE